MSAKPSLQVITEPEAFFHELVTTAMGNQQVNVQPETEFYLVHLLKQFISAEKLYTRDENGSLKEEPLALMLQEALGQTEPQQQRSLLRHIGDVSLYIAGFFQESLARKLVDVDYYIELGGVAYQQIAQRVDEKRFQELFGELAAKFPRCVDVLAEVSEKTTPVNTEIDILRAYEVWVKTRSDRAAKVLEKAGIIPNDTIKKDWQ